MNKKHIKSEGEMNIYKKNNTYLSTCIISRKMSKKREKTINSGIILNYTEKKKNIGLKR